MDPDKASVIHDIAARLREITDNRNMKQIVFQGEFYLPVAKLLRIKNYMKAKLFGSRMIFQLLARGFNTISKH